VFIAELGRQDKVRQPYDILLDVDPAKTQLDTLQIAFITKRLAADLAVLAYPDRSGRNRASFSLQWLVRPALRRRSLRRSRGCARRSRRTGGPWGQPFAFDELMDHLRGIGIDDAEKLSNIGALADVLLRTSSLRRARRHST